ATRLFAADREVSKFTVLIGASLALIVASAIGLLAGGLRAEVIDPKYITWVAGVGFILVGIFTLVTA
ncbi:MAG: TMEM165/GDT1 family protein, partial [Pseudomonadales bacterium]|nr:TMEM165/GDT1 family protein [Pseudomonadales bacterium]